MRTGFVAVVGRPNVGKSTLVNAMVGSKVTITASRPNTTRHNVRGVVHRPDGQMVLVDTPGIHRPRTALGERLNEAAGASLEDVDVVMVVVDATAPIGPGDRLVLGRALRAARVPARPEAGSDEEVGRFDEAGGDEEEVGRFDEAVPEPGPGDSPWVVVVVNKIDVAGRARVAERLAEAAEAVERLAAEDARLRMPAEEVEYFPVSASTGRGVGALLDTVAERLPEGPAYFPPDMVTDTPEALRVAELVREQLLRRARDELPHSIACRVTEWEWPHIRCEILVERDSQKAIVIGRGGSVLKEVGTVVRRELPPGAYLELFVRVEKRWQQRPDALDRLGY